VIIDMLDGFMAPDGVVPVPMNDAILPSLNRLCAATREAGGVNIFVRFTYDPAWTSYYGRFAKDRREAFRDAFTPGAPLHRLTSGLDVQDGDVILDKLRFSSFTPGTCDLESVTRNRGIDTLIISGCTSNCCCESTARDALQMNYKVIFVEDATATLSDEMHNSTVANLFSAFGCDVCNTEEVIGRMEPAG
jgi:ureidoacrylate peracid hydrolase